MIIQFSHQKPLQNAGFLSDHSKFWITKKYLRFATFASKVSRDARSFRMTEVVKFFALVFSRYWVVSMNVFFRDREQTVKG